MSLLLPEVFLEYFSFFSQLLIVIPIGNYCYDGEDKVCPNSLLNLKRGLFFCPIPFRSLSFADKKSRLRVIKSRLAPRDCGLGGEMGLVRLGVPTAYGSVC